MEQIINGKRYDTEKSTLIADDCYWDGSNHDRQGRNTSLYKTAKKRFFLHHETRWQGERDSIEPVSKEHAMEMFEVLPEQKLNYEDAFGVTPEEA